MESELLKPKEVAEILRVDLRTVYRMRNRGEITGIKLSERTLRFKKEEVVELLRRMEQ